MANRLLWIVNRVAICLLLFASSASNEIKTFHSCGKDGWTCDDNKTEATYDCKHVPEDKPIEIIEVKEGHQTEGDWWEGDVWIVSYKDSSSSDVKKLIYKNCYCLHLDLRTDDEHVTDYLVFRNVVNLSLGKKHINCYDSDDYDYDHLELLEGCFHQARLKNEKPVRWPKHLELQNVWFFTTEWEMNGKNLTNVSMENVTISADQLDAKLENATVSMTNVQFKRLNFELKNGNFTMKKNLISHKLPKYPMETDVTSDIFLFEDNTVTEMEHRLLRLTVRTVNFTGNSFGHIHPDAFSNVKRDTSADSAAQFIFSRNKIFHLAATAFEMPDVESKSLFDYVKFENNTIECGCRIIEFLQVTKEASDLPIRSQPIYKHFADSNFCLTDPKCEARKISSVKNIEAFCTGKHLDDDGCLRVGEELTVPKSKIFPRVNSSEMKEEALSEILKEMRGQSARASNETVTSVAPIINNINNITLFPNWFLVIAVIGVILFVAYPFVRRLLDSRGNLRCSNDYTDANGSRARLACGSRSSTEIEMDIGDTRPD